MDRQKTRLAVKVSLVFTIYIYTNTSKTFYSSTNETRFCEAACVFYYYDRKSIRILQRVVD